MVSLTPTCEKLVDRSIRIVSKAVECPREQAAELLEKAEGSVQVAILLGKTGLSVDEARTSLETEPLNQLLQRLVPG